MRRSIRPRSSVTGSSEEVWMMETKSSMQEQARIQQAADEAFRGLADHEGDHSPAMQIVAEFPLRNADPQVGQLRRPFFVFAIAALAAAIFISLYLGVVKTTALPSELATARSDFETMAELASKAADETAQLKKTAEAATAELQQERQKTAALTSELVAARSDFETMAELASKAADKAAQLKKSTEAAIAELQQERQKTAAPTSELPTTRPDFETKLVSSSKAADETAQLRKTAEAAIVELQQEHQKTAALTSELAAAQLKATETVQLKQAEATESATLLKQEREKTTALAQEVADARQELTTSTAKHLQALDEERERRAALRANWKRHSAKSRPRRRNCAKGVRRQRPEQAEAVATHNRCSRSKKKRRPCAGSQDAQLDHKPRDETSLKR